MRNVLRRRRLLFRQGGLTYLLRDEFGETAAALPATRACVPGPGTLAVTDTASKLSLSGGKVVCAGATAAWSDPRLVAAAGFPRLAGRALLVNFNQTGGSNAMVSWSNGTTGGTNAPHSAYPNGTNLRYRAGTSDFIVASDQAVGTAYDYLLVLRGTGCFLLRRLAGGGWTLLWLDPADATATMFPHVLTGETAGSYAADYLRVLDLGGSWASDYGIATQRLAGSQAAGTTFAHTADCLAEFTLTTRPTAGSALVFFRQQDASNYWQAEVNSAGDFLLKEVVAGTPTTRGTAAAVVTSGHRCVVIAEGTTIRGFSNNTLRWTYSSATNFQTATAGQLNAVGTGGVVSDIIAWPRNVAGYLPSGL